MSVHGALQSSPAPVEQPARHDHVPDQQRKLMTTGEICERAGISRWTWRKWERSGYAPARVPNLPGMPRWRAADIAKFLDGHAHGRHFFGRAR